MFAIDNPQLLTLKILIEMAFISPFSFYFIGVIPRLAHGAQLPLIFYIFKIKGECFFLLYLTYLRQVRVS